MNQGRRSTQVNWNRLSRGRGFFSDWKRRQTCDARLRLAKRQGPGRDRVAGSDPREAGKMSSKSLGDEKIESLAFGGYFRCAENEVYRQVHVRHGMGGALDASESSHRLHVT